MVRSAGPAARPSGCARRVHPILLNQYAALTQALFRIWAELGVEVEVATKTMPEFLESWLANEGHRRHARPLDRRLRRPGQLHLHALPLRKRRRTRLLLLAENRPHPGGGPRARPVRPPARRSIGSSSTRCSTPRSSSRSSTRWTTGSPAPGSGACSCAAPPPTSTTPSSERPSRGGAGSRRRPAIRAEESSTCRSPASSGASIPSSARRRSRARW